MNFSKAVAPEGTSSMYIEITYQPGQKPNRRRGLSNVRLRISKRCGILRPGGSHPDAPGSWISSPPMSFSTSTVSAHLQNLIGYLESRDIHTAGRYGQLGLLLHGRLHPQRADHCREGRAGSPPSGGKSGLGERSRSTLPPVQNYRAFVPLDCKNCAVIDRAYSKQVCVFLPLCKARTEKISKKSLSSFHNSFRERGPDKFLA